MSTWTVRPTPIVITGPSVEPVSLEFVKSHCVVSGSDDDALLSTMIAAARRKLEQRTGAVVMERTLEVRFDAFPNGPIRLDTGPVRAIEWVKYTDGAGQDQTLSSVLYTLDNSAQYGYVIPVYGTDWPSTLDTPNAVRVRYPAGVAQDASDVPENLRLWIAIQVATYYRNREAFVQGVSVADVPDRFVDSLLDDFTRITV